MCARRESGAQVPGPVLRLKYRLGVNRMPGVLHFNCPVNARATGIYKERSSSSPLIYRRAHCASWWVWWGQESCREVAFESPLPRSRPAGWGSAASASAPHHHQGSVLTLLIWGCCRSEWGLHLPRQLALQPASWHLAHPAFRVLPLQQPASSGGTSAASRRLQG